MTFAVRISSLRGLAIATISLVFVAPALDAQGTLADYQRAHELRTKARDLVVGTPGPMNWIGNSDHFWYPKTVKGGTEFVLADATGASKKPAFDQDRLATAISKATGHPYTALKLPFAPMQGRPGARPTPGAAPMTAPLTFLDNESAIQFGTGGSLYKCTLSDYNCTKTGPIPSPNRGGRDAEPEDESLNPEESLEGPGGDPVDGLEYLPPAPQDGAEGRFEGRQPSCAPTPESRRARPQPRPERAGIGSQILEQLPPEPPEVCASFDGKWEALIQNFNVFLRPAGDRAAHTR